MQVKFREDVSRSFSRVRRVCSEVDGSSVTYFTVYMPHFISYIKLMYCI